eukprot:CAMPEP_0185750500 /NCGR_PEP_ID=MMETSP1174-20130828/9285_1 /TAXON_ID=35687 /ORGANISM="Dictyocha speculum, Strain CCMP1381" /LENGTH=499 /DNA_ID=CAMNT_0028427095 /DNA_START=78 /DNA_END=1577 /DNA_ORIENTATION=-
MLWENEDLRFNFMSTVGFKIKRPGDGAVKEKISDATGLTWAGEDDSHKHPMRSHPERPERIQACLEVLREEKLIAQCLRVRSSTDHESDVISSSIHSPHYLARLKPKRLKRLAAQTYGHGQSGLIDEAEQYDSVYLTEHSGRAAQRALAESLSLVDALTEGRIRNGMALVRPPGHHAERCCAKGFCLLNNVAECAQVLVTRGERVLIVDWDVHHGNGTQSMFEQAANPMYFSLHRHDRGSFYPGASDTKACRESRPHDASAQFTGSGAGRGYTVNVAWNGGGAGDDEYLTAFESLLIPIANQFRPTVILVSAGFDAALGEPLGGCRVTSSYPDGGFASMTRALCQRIPSACGRVLLVLEGGYKTSVLSRSVASCLRVLLEKSNSAGPMMTSLEQHTYDEDGKATTIKRPRVASTNDITLFEEVAVSAAVPSLRHQGGGLLPQASKAINEVIEAHEEFWALDRKQPPDDDETGVRGTTGAVLIDFFPHEHAAEADENVMI